MLQRLFWNRFQIVVRESVSGIGSGIGIRIGSEIKIGFEIGVGFGNSIRIGLGAMMLLIDSLEESKFICTQSILMEISGLITLLKLFISFQELILIPVIGANCDSQIGSDSGGDPDSGDDSDSGIDSGVISIIGSGIGIGIVSGVNSVIQRPIPMLKSIPIPNTKSVWGPATSLVILRILI